MRKKILAVFLVLVLLIGMGAGACGGGEVTPPPSEEEESVTPPDGEEEAPVTLSPLAQDLSARIAAINLDDTTALTSLFRIYDELDQAQTDGSLSEGEWTELQADLMAQFTDWVNTREERLGLNSLPPATTGNITWTKQEKTLLEGAEERIEQYRKGDATILVVDAAGVPVADAEVHLDMLKHDFLFGAFLFTLDKADSLSLNQAYLDAFAKLLNYATLCVHWVTYEPVRGREDEAGLKVVALWTSDHGIAAKGHTLVWPAWGTPYWALQLSQEELDNILPGRVTRLVTKFSGLIDYWDVVNEPTFIGGYPYVGGYLEPLRSWMLAQTPAGATARVLGWARAANPEATLLVNDWWTGVEYHKLLEHVIAAGGQFDAIGIQSLMHTRMWTLKETWDICERFKDFNVPLHFTEVTVLSGNLKTDTSLDYHPGWDTTPEGEAIQGEYVPAFYTILFSHPSVQAITWPDLTDLDAWQGAPGGLLRKDMSPKPAYEQLMRLINKEWWTNAEATTNAQGEAVLRGFYGQYLLTIESGTQKIQMLIHLEAGKDNIFEVQLP